MAKFEIAYFGWVEPNEGGFANLKNDKGGITYAGISSKFWPNWEGWPVVQAKMKANGGDLKNNTKIPELKNLVTKFYLDLWNSKGFFRIQDQNVANIMFDWGVHSGTSTPIKALQRLLGVTVDGKFGPVTAAKLNASKNTTKIYATLVNDRREFLKSLIAKDPSQEVHAKGWFARMDKFKVVGGTSLIVIAVVAVLLVIFNK